MKLHEPIRPLRPPDEPTLEEDAAEFVQIAVSPNASYSQPYIFALDRDGNVWKYERWPAADADGPRWEKLDTARGSA